MAGRSKTLQLLLGGLGAAVPGLGQACDRLAGIRPGELQCRDAERVVRELPNLPEYVAARAPLSIALRRASLHRLLQSVHAGIGVPPGIAEQFRIERLYHF